MASLYVQYCGQETYLKKVNFDFSSVTPDITYTKMAHPELNYAPGIELLKVGDATTTLTVLVSAILVFD
jgi:hypothetical protein